MSSGTEHLKTQIKEFLKWVKRKRRLCIAFHNNGDPDAVAAAIALAEVVHSLNPPSKIYVVAPEGIDSASKRLLKQLNLQETVLPYPPPEKCSRYIIVDTSTKTQLGELGKELKPKKYAVLDHHVINELVKDAEISVYGTETSSSSELAAMVMKEVGVTVRSEVLTLLIAGILYDTRMLRLAKASTFRTLADLMESGGGYSEASKLLTSREISKSEKVAKLKGISRAGIYELNKEWLMAITCIGAHESSVLKVLIDSGADLAIAVAKRKGETRVSIRATDTLINRLNAPVSASITKRLGELLGGEGGGHAGAAGAKIPGRVPPKEFLKALRKTLTELGLRITTLEEGRWLTECE